MAFYLINNAKDKIEEDDYFDLDSFRIRPVNQNPEEMTAVPQYSFGLPLNKIKKHAEYFSMLSNDEKKITTGGHEHLDGLVFLIKKYIQKGQNVTLNYPKQIADDFMLARTDFGVLFKLAMSKDKVYKKSKFCCFNFLYNSLSLENWLNYFNCYTLDDRLFFNGIMPDEDIKKYPTDCPYEKIREEALKNSIGLTIKDWLTAIYNEGRDLLSEVVDAESLGSYGEKKDKTPDGYSGIFEQRCEQGQKILHTEWKSYAMEAYDRVADLTGADPSDLSIAKK